MKRLIPDLHFNQHGVENTLEGLFLVRVDPLYLEILVRITNANAIVLRKSFE